MAELAKFAQQDVDGLKEVERLLFSDGKIESYKDFQKRLQAGNLTVRDAYLAKAYRYGLKISPIMEENPDTSAIAKKLKKAFPATQGAGQSIKGLADEINVTVKNKISLDDLFDDRSDNLQKVSTLKKSIEKVKEGKKPVAQGTRLLGNALLDNDKEILKAMAEGLAKMPNGPVKDAIVEGMMGNRFVDVEGMRSTLKQALETEIERPFYNIETGVQENPDRTIRKQLGPSKQLPPVTNQIYRNRYATAGPTGELFKGVTRTQINAALKKIFSEIPESIQVQLKRDLSKNGTYTDLRRITAAFVAKSLGDVKGADMIISHSPTVDDLSLDGRISQVFKKFYVNIKDPKNLIKVSEGLALFEREIARQLVGPKATAGDLANALGVDVPETFDAKYPTTKIIIDDTGKTGTIETFEREPEDIEADKKTKKLRTEQTQAGIVEETEKRTGRTLDLQMSNLEKKSRINELQIKVAKGEAELAEINELDDLKSKKPVKSGLDTWIEKNPEAYQSIQRPARKPKIRNKNFKKTQPNVSGTKLKSFALINAPFAKLFFDAYFSDAKNEGYDDEEATTRALLLTASDVTPGIAEAKFAYEAFLPKTAGAAELDPFEAFKSDDQIISEQEEMQAKADESYFRESISPQLDDELDVQKQMNIKEMGASFRREAERKSQLSLDEQMQMLNQGS